MFAGPGAPRQRTVVVTGSGSGDGCRAARLLGRAGARVVTVGGTDADILADLRAPAGRSAMVRGVAAFTGGVVDGVVVPARADHPDALDGEYLGGGDFGLPQPGPQGIEQLYFAPVSALAGLRTLLAGSPAPHAVAVTRSVVSHAEADPELVQACLAGDEGRAIELADRLQRTAGPAAVEAAAALALSVWLERQAGTREWAGRGIPLVEVGSPDAGVAALLAG